MIGYITGGQWFEIENMWVRAIDCCCFKVFFSQIFFSRLAHGKSYLCFDFHDIIHTLWLFNFLFTFFFCFVVVLLFAIFFYCFHKKVWILCSVNWKVCGKSVYFFTTDEVLKSHEFYWNCLLKLMLAKYNKWIFQQ